MNVSDVLARYEKGVARSGITPLKQSYTQIAPLSEASLLITLTIPDRTTKIEKVKLDLTQEDLESISLMPKKVQAKMERLCRLNLDKAAQQGLSTKENPFKSVGYLFVAYEALLSGGFTRASLRQLYQEKLKWNENTAFPHVSTIVWLFPAMNIAVQEMGMFKPNPKFMSDN